MFVIKRNQVIITALVVMIAVAGYLNYTDSRIDTPAGFVYSRDGDIQALVPDGNSLNAVVEVSTNNSDSDMVTLENLTNVEVIPDGIGIALTMDEESEAVSNNNSESISATATPSETPSAAPQTSSTNTDSGEALFVNADANLSDGSFFVQAKLDRENSRSKQKELLLDMINNQNLEQDKKAEFADAMLDIQKRIEKESAAEAMIESKGFSEVFVRIDDTTVDVVVDKENLTDAEVAQIEDIIKRKTGMEAESIRISPMKRSSNSN